MSDATNLFHQINQPGPEPSEMAKKHCAAVCVHDQPVAGQPLTVHIRVGSVPHPMENGHHIQFLDLFVDDLYVSRVSLTPVVNSPEATLHVTLAREGKTTLRVVSRCNLHGLWEGTRGIVVQKR
jgi:superoxide reductase